MAWRWEVSGSVRSGKLPDRSGPATCPTGKCCNLKFSCTALQFLSVAIPSMQCCQYSIGIAIKEPFSPWAQASEIECNLVQYQCNLSVILSNFVPPCCNPVQCQSATLECQWRSSDNQLCIGVGDNAWIDRLLGGHLRQASERREINFKPIYTINSRDQS